MRDRLLLLVDTARDMGATQVEVTLSTAADVKKMHAAFLPDEEPYRWGGRGTSGVIDGVRVRAWIGVVR